MDFVRFAMYIDARRADVKKAKAAQKKWEEENA